MPEENGRAAGESLAALLAGGEAGQPALIVPEDVYRSSTYFW